VAKIVKLLVTGAAGFIGFHTARRLLERGDEVVGLDNLNAYYDPGLKAARLDILRRYPAFRFVKMDIADREPMDALFRAEKFRRVVHLAAQAGVRYSIINPHAYVQSNIVGFLHVIEGCRHNGVEHLVYASTSSVYGANTRMPFSEGQNTDHPLTLYAATKKSNELMAHSYSSLYALRIRPIRPPAQPPIKSTISAISGRWLCCATSMCSNAVWGGRRRRTCCPCSPEICRIPGPMSRPWRETSDTGRARIWKRG
jgi:UDP-glucuronate 4-epimerase